MLTPEQEAEWFGSESKYCECGNEFEYFGNIWCNRCSEDYCKECLDYDRESDEFICSRCFDASKNAETFDAEIPKSVKLGFGFGAGLALFQVAVIGTAMILGARRQ